MDYEAIEVVNQAELDALALCESVIQKGLETFVEVGNALMEVRDKRLYRQNHETFEAYCRERWGMARRTAYQYIDAADVVENVRHGTHNEVPKNERQARPLTKLEPEQQAKAWSEAVETAPNGKVTAAHVKATVDRLHQEDPLSPAEPQAHVPSYEIPWSESKGNGSGETLVIADESGHEETLSIADDESLAVISSNEPSAMSVHFSSETPEHYTPKDFLFYVYECLGDVDLDPCSNSKVSPNVNAELVYTADDDGLSKEWGGKVFMNPPYGNGIGDWVEKLCLSYEDGQVSEAIALLPARTDTKWYSRINNYPMLLIEGRLKFGELKNSAPFPSVVFYLGGNLDMFINCFRQMGKIFTPIELVHNESTDSHYLETPHLP